MEQRGGSFAFCRRVTHLSGGHAAGGEHDARSQDAGDEQVDQLVVQSPAHDLHAGATRWKHHSCERHRVGALLMRTPQSGGASHATAMLRPWLVLLIRVLVLAMRSRQTSSSGIAAAIGFDPTVWHRKAPPLQRQGCGEHMVHGTAR